MSDASPFPPESATSSVGNAKSGNMAVIGIRAALYMVLAAAIAVVTYAGYQATQAASELRRRQDDLVSTHGLTVRTPKHLVPEYIDKDGRLLADPPADPKQLLDPDTLVVAHYQDVALKEDAPVKDDAAAIEDPVVKTQLVDWDEFQKFLAQATGKKVVVQEYQNTAGDVAAVKAGTIQIVAWHAADTPYLVNNAGFIPVAVLGSDAVAHGNRLDLAVRAASGIKSLADLKGHTLTCTAPDSITGYRAAVAILDQEAGLRPDVDYYVNFSLGQRRSVLGVATGEFEVAALSDDKVQNFLKKGTIKESDYRVIYQSEVIPRLTIGYVYNLRPELAAKVARAVLDFKNEHGAEDVDSGESMRFFPVDYKKDFDFVRKIDDSFDPRFGKSPKIKRDSSG